MLNLNLFLAVILVLGLGYLILRFNLLWIYKLFDRALHNDRKVLPKKYELPNYFNLNTSGEVDTSACWPGWDGWYFFMIPEARTLPVKLIRASLMTGLYGLEGIDNYENLLLRLSTFEAVECLTLIPTEGTIGGRAERENYLSQHYLPKATDLLMSSRALDVAVQGNKTDYHEEIERYGRVRGAWPDYEFEFINPEADIRVLLRFKGENILWWADIPHVFTYFAAFGKFDGKIIYRRGSSRNDAHKLVDKEETYAIQGAGCFEHGFARKPFNFDILWAPFRLLKDLIPSLRFLRYHYELFIGDDNCQGGFMQARAFGIDFRNGGGLYLNGSYRRIHSVKIEYLEDPEPDLVATNCFGAPVVFYRRWQVSAVTEDGLLRYVGTREWPPACVASNMIYYNFSYEGTYKGEPIRGRGYGEYMRI